MPGRMINTIGAVALALGAMAVGTAALAQDAAKTLTIAKSTDAVSLDPHQATAAPSVWVYTNIYDTLVSETRDLGIAPSLATSWENINPKTWRFHLREDVQFHDGTPFNAQAVKFTFDRALNEENPARGLSMAGPISKVEVVDEHTVDISTTEPYGPFLQAISEVFVFGIVSPTAVEKHGDEYGRHPVGTGPFAFESWDKNSQIVLERNDNYWGDKAKIDRLVFRVIPEASSQVLAFGAQEIDGIMSPDPSLLPRLEQDGADIYQIPGLRQLYIGFNTKKPVVSDVRVRRALNHLVDRAALADKILKGSAAPAVGYLPKQVFGFHDTGIYEYNPEKARELFADAGWTPGPDGKLQKDGEPLTLTFWGYSGRDPNSRQLAQAVQGMLQNEGVTVDLQVWDYAQLGSAIWRETPEDPSKAPYDIYMLGWTTITGDADFTLYGTFSDISMPPDGLNATFWAPDEYMAALDTGRFSTDQNEREEAYQKALSMTHEAAPRIPLVVLTQVAAFQPYVTGYEPHPVEYYMLEMQSVDIER